MRRTEISSPASFLCTITERRRCRSIPTYCPDIGASSVRGLAVESTDLVGFPRGAEAPLRHRITSRTPPQDPVRRRGGRPFGPNRTRLAVHGHARRRRDEGFL